MSRNTEHILLFIKCFVYVYYMQVLASAITVDPDAPTEKLPAKVLKEMQEYEAELQKHLHPLIVKRETNYNVLENNEDDEKSLNDPPYLSPEKKATTYIAEPTIHATKSDGVVIVATARIGGEEMKYTYDQSGDVTKNVLYVKDITSRFLYNYYGYVTGTKYTVTGINAQGATEIDIASVTSTFSTYTNYQDGTYSSPPQLSIPLALDTKTVIYQDALGSLTTTIYTIHDTLNTTDALAYNTYTSTDNSGNIITNTITKFEAEITEGNNVKTTLLTYTGLGTVVTSTDFYGNPTVVTSVNEVTVSTDATGGQVTRTIPPVENPLLTSVQTITTTDANGNTVTETTTMTGQGPVIPIPYTTTITDSASTARAGLQTISPTSTTDTMYSTIFDSSMTRQPLDLDAATSTEGETVTTDINGNRITLDSNGNIITTVQDDTTKTATLTSQGTTVVTTTSLDSTVTESDTVFEIDLDGSIASFPSTGISSTDDTIQPTVTSTSSSSTTESQTITTDANGSTITIDPSGDIITIITTVQDDTTKILTLTSQDTTVITATSGDSIITKTDTIFVSDSTTVEIDSEGSITSLTGSDTSTSKVSTTESSTIDLVTTGSNGEATTNIYTIEGTIETTIPVLDDTITKTKIILTSSGSSIVEIVQTTSGTAITNTFIISASAVTDSSGNTVTDANSDQVTELVTEEIETATETTTSSGSGSNSDSDLGSESGSSSGSGSGSDSGSGSGAGSDSGSMKIIEYNGTVIDCNETSYIYSLQQNLTQNLSSFGNKKCPFNKIEAFVQEMPTKVESTGFALVWNAPQDGLLLTDRYAKQVLRLSPSTGNWVHLYLVARHLDAILPTTDPEEYVIVADKIIVSIETTFTKDGLIVKYKKLFASFDSSIGFSVARTDPTGRLWLSVRYKADKTEKENLYMFCNGTATIQETIIQRTGGMAWTPDKQHYFISDLASRVIYAYDYNDRTGSIQNRQTLIDFKEYTDFVGTPYDIAVDSMGGLWVAMFGNREVIKLNSGTWKVEKRIILPHSYPVSLAFGSADLDKLFVATAFNNDTESLPFVYAIGNTGVKGHNPTYAITPHLIFGNNTMKITIEGADPQPLDPTYEMLPFIESNIPSTVMKYTTVAKNACAFAQTAPIIQMTQTSISTIGMAMHYDTEKRALFMVDVFKPAVMKWTESNGEAVILTFANVTSTTTIIPIKGKSKQYLVAEDNQIVVLENSFQQSETLNRSRRSIIASLNNPNENLLITGGKTDSKGRLWFGTRHTVTKQGKGCKLYCLTKKSLKEMDHGYNQITGIAWSKDKTKMYVADAKDGIIYVYKYNESTGEISNRVEMFSVNNTDYEKYQISDIVVDNEDHIWTAILGGRAVIQITPSGEIKREIIIPDKYPTALEFGGENRDHLFVGTWRAGLAGCTVDNQASLYVISNLGVTAGDMETNRFNL